MIYDDAVAQVAESLGLSRSYVDKVYKAYWRVIKEHISALPLKEDLTDEEFNKLQPNVNIPSIGKLYVTLENYKKIKYKYKETISN